MEEIQLSKHQRCVEILLQQGAESGGYAKQKYFKRFDAT